MGTSYRIQDLRPCPFKNPLALSEIFCLETRNSNETWPLIRRDCRHQWTVIALPSLKVMKVFKFIESSAAGVQDHVTTYNIGTNNYALHISFRSITNVRNSVTESMKLPENNCFIVTVKQHILLIIAASRQLINSGIAPLLPILDIWSVLDLILRSRLSYVGTSNRMIIRFTPLRTHWRCPRFCSMCNCTWQLICD